MWQWIDQYIEQIVIVQGLLILLLIGLFIYVLFRLSSMRKKYKRMVGESGKEQLEDVLVDIQQRLQDFGDRQNKHAVLLDETMKRMTQMKAKVGICRYNAFSHTGSDLSFSIALIDDERNGIVISGIHNRENIMVYAKPVEKGESNYTLTPEEKKAIQEAK